MSQSPELGIMRRSIGKVKIGLPVQSTHTWDRNTNPEEWGLEGVFEELVAVVVAEEPVVSPECVFTNMLDWDSFLTFSPLQD
jgi:hypothetical protein